MIDPGQVADFLFDNRLQQRVVDNIPESIYPVSAGNAYQVQERLVSKLCKHYNSETCGYKLGCTNKMAMELLGVSEPISGRLLNYSNHPDGAVLAATDFVHRVIELEFAFVLGQDVPESTEPYTAHSIKAFIEKFVPAIEIVDHRYTDFTQVGSNALIADNAIHGASIFGSPNVNWQTIDLSRYPVELMVNEKSWSTGSGSNVLGDPLNVMAWLANHLRSRGYNLKSGDTVSTGTACDVYYAEAGDHILADFGKLGSVSVSFI